MRNEDRKRLPGRAFYGAIVAGVVLGVAAAVWAGVEYLKGERRPEARRIWGDAATTFVLPIAGMIGGTFGGLAGVVAAVAWDRHSRRSA